MTRNKKVVDGLEEVIVAKYIKQYEAEANAVAFDSIMMANSKEDPAKMSALKKAAKAEAEVLKTQIRQLKAQQKIAQTANLDE